MAMGAATSTGGALAGRAGGDWGGPGSGWRGRSVIGVKNMGQSWRFRVRLCPSG